MWTRVWADRPLQAVFIDHIKVDVMVMDHVSGDALGRPWLTLGFDSLTRMVTGFHLAMTPPSKISTSLCLLHSVCSKKRWLGERRVEADWPVAGLPETVRVDANSFYGLRKFGRACKDMAMEAVLNDVRQPNYGECIEALIGRRLGDIALSRDQACVHFDGCETRPSPNLRQSTISELERELALEIACDYHHRRHKGLRSAPMDAWRHHQPAAFRAPADCLRFRLAFLPEEECMLHEDGIRLLGHRFWSRALANHFESGSARLIIKYDPRDLTQVFAHSPTGRFLKLKHRADLHPQPPRPFSRSVEKGSRTGRAESTTKPRVETNQAAFLVGSADFLERKCVTSCPFAGAARRECRASHEFRAEPQ
jgi:putative transposase